MVNQPDFAREAVALASCCARRGARRRTLIAAMAGTMMVPLSSFAQRTAKSYRIGFLGVTSAATQGSMRRVEAFRSGLRALGYVEGRNVVIEFRWAEGNVNRLPDLARELVRLPVDVLVAQGSTGTRVAREVGSTIPIVMLAVGDAVGAGLIASLAKPGGNITGSTFLGPEIYAKQLELLREAIPGVARVALLMNPTNPGNRAVLQEVEVGARTMKMTVTRVDAREPSEFEGAFRTIAARNADAVVVSADALLTANSAAIADLAISRRLPTASAWLEFAESGGLLAYGANIYELYRRAPYFVDRILKGAKPADLPVEQPTRFDLIINLKTAKVLGLTIPQPLVQRANDVIQ